MTGIARLAELKLRAKGEIERLQDFHVFTGHSYDVYSKMVSAKHLAGTTVVNTRTGSTLESADVATELLHYLDDYLPRVVLFELVAVFEDFFRDLQEVAPSLWQRSRVQGRNGDRYRPTLESLGFAAMTVDTLAELMETRHVFAHRGCLADDKYVRNSGVMARVAAGQRLSAPRAYVYESADFLKRLIVEIADSPTASFCASRQHR